MVQITLSDFLDFVNKAGPSKLTKVRRLKRRPPYRPSFDYYRPLREAIIAGHRAGSDRREIDEVLNAALVRVEDERVQLELSVVADSYRGWLGRKRARWFEPGRVPWVCGDVSILVNPDLGLFIDGRPCVIKIWFRDDPLEKRVLDVVFRLMEEALGASCPAGTSFCVLDVRRGRLFSPTVDVPAAGVQLQGEVAYLAATWDTA